MGPATIVASFREMSWRLLVVMFFPAAVLKLLDALGWRCALPHEPVSLRRLGTALVAGQAIASTTPTGAVGGDAVKAWVLRDDISRRASLSSLIIVETTSTMSQGIFLLVGILLARQTLASAAPLVRVMQWLLVLEAIAVAGFVAVQFGGMATRIHGLLERFGLAGATGLGAAAAHVDRSLSDFYRHQPRRLTLSVLCNFLGWIAGAVEVWLILYFLGATVSVTMALIIEAFGTGISFATFFLPVQLGVDEGGAVATFLALGLNGATGLSLTLVRRVRELTWITIGLMLLAGSPRSVVAAVNAREA
jgi:uncharacterized protein (TIRG00374 family)